MALAYQMSNLLFLIAQLEIVGPINRVKLFRCQTVKNQNISRFSSAK